jgi:hypothetical protein
MTALAKPTEIDISQPLTEKEQADYAKLQAVISEGLERMEKAGRALIEIRDRKLYRAEFTTFQKYCDTKWAISVRRAYQICGFADVVDNLRTNGAQILPSNERQVRELAKVEPAEQPKVWETVLENGKPTAEKIARVVKVRTTSKKPPSVIVDVEQTPIELAAKSFGVSVGAIETAKAIKEIGGPLFQQIKAGEVPLPGINWTAFEDEFALKISGENDRGLYEWLNHVMMVTHDCYEAFAQSIKVFRDRQLWELGHFQNLAAWAKDFEKRVSASREKTGDDK